MKLQDHGMTVVYADEVTGPWDGRVVCGCGPMQVNRTVANIIVGPLKL